MDYRNPRSAITVALVQLRSTAVPETLAVPADIVALCEDKLPALHDFEIEHKVLDQHETLKRKPSFMTMLEDSGVSSPTDSDGFITATIAHTPTASTREAHTVQPPPLVTQSSFNMSDIAAKQRKIAEMASSTGAEEEVCGFFLESMDWNMDEALTMYYSTKS